MSENCVFIKTKNTPGNVEVHVATADSGFQQHGGDWPTWFSSGDADNGTWTMADMTGDGRPDLVFIKTKNTPGNVEVHVATADSGFQQHGGDWPTWFSSGDADNGTWTMADMTGDGRPDLVFIKTKNTPGNVEVHVATADSGFQQHGGDWPTWFSSGDADNGTWTMADMTGDGRPDLVFIKTKNTPGNVEVHVATADSGFQQHGGDWPTWFSSGDADNGTWTMADMTGDGRPDLVFIKTKNTPGNVEVHVATADSGFQQHGGDWPTWFSSGDADNGTWTMSPSTLIVGSVQADDGSTISWITEGSTIIARGTQGRQMIIKQTTDPSGAAAVATVFSDADGEYLSITRTVFSGLFENTCTVDLGTPSAKATIGLVESINDLASATVTADVASKNYTWSGLVDLSQNSTAMFNPIGYPQAVAPSLAKAGHFNAALTQIRPLVNADVSFGSFAFHAILFGLGGVLAAAAAAPTGGLSLVVYGEVFLIGADISMINDWQQTVGDWYGNPQIPLLDFVGTDDGGDNGD